MAEDPGYLVAANWKMNGLRADSIQLVRKVVSNFSAVDPVRCEIAICPPAVLLFEIGGALVESPIELGGQDCHMAAAGAHTGDIAAPMLADAGCKYVIVGHSERRADHGETSEMVREKAAAALEAGLIPIICVGESEAERDAGEALAIVGGQLERSLPDGIGSDRLVIAYEPVWAIGTGKTPSLDEIAEVHALIRETLGGGIEGPAAVRILYGGSVKPENAVDILALDNVNGALVGGASLNADSFWAICTSCA